MKKVILTLAASFIAAFSLQAQTVADATDAYNQAAQYLESGDYSSAAAYFKEALSIAEKCESGADEIISNCKATIAKVEFEVAKGFLRDKQYDKAIAQYLVAKADAAKYGDEETEIQVEDVLPKAYLQKANSAMQSKDFASCIDAASKAVELDPKNGSAYLILGNAYMQSGKTTQAIDAFKNAAANGKEKDANKKLSTIYLKLAQASLKSQKYAEVIKYCEQSNAYGENANAYKLAASASQKTGNNAKMIEYYEKYLAVSPNASDAAGVNFTIAATYQTMGNKEKAKAYYQKVTSDPTYGPQATQQLDALNR